MKKLLFIITLLFSFNAMAEDRWTLMYKDEESSTYIDEASILKVGNKAYGGETYFIWELLSYHEIQQVVTLPLKYYTFKGSSRMSLWEMSCETLRFYPVVEYSFSELMGKGIKIDTMNYTAPRWKLWEPTEMFPLKDMLAKRLCEGKNE